MQCHIAFKYAQLHKKGGYEQALNHTSSKKCLIPDKKSEKYFCHFLFFYKIVTY